METKKCGSCKKEKSIDLFYNNKNSIDGKDSRCKPCKRIYDIGYFNSKKGIISRIYGGQVRSSIDRGHSKPEYTKKELTKWLFSHDLFNDLYNNWEKSFFKKELKPSIDRINDYKSYTLVNIQLMTWGENRNKGHRDRKNGINNKVSKAVLQFSLKGKFIKEYHSINEAERQTGIYVSTICCSCNGRLKTENKFKWEYKNQTV